MRQAVEIDKMKFGFRPGTGTANAIFVTRQLQERYRGKHRELWWAFVDLEKAFDRVPRKVVGNFYYGTRNVGERILEFAEAMGYVVTSSLFKKRQSHLVTYESGGNKTAVDMILIKREYKKRIMNTKVIPGEECVHGHHLVVMDIHLKVRKYRKNHQGLHKVQPRIKVWKLKKQEVRKAYLEKLKERDIDIEDSVRVEEQWGQG